MYRRDFDFCFSECKVPRELTLDLVFEWMTELLVKESSIYEEVRQCFLEIDVFVKRHKKWYQNYGVMTYESPTIMRWIGILAILEQHHYICRISKNGNRDVLITRLNELLPVKRNKMSLDKRVFDANGGLCDILQIINKRWYYRFGYILRGFQVQADCYIIGVSIVRDDKKYVL